MSGKCRKRNSLQRHFTLLFAFVFSLLLILLLVGNSFFLESLYENRKVYVLEKAYVELDRILQQGEGFSKDFPTEEEIKEGKETSASKYVRYLTEKENISIIVMDDSSEGVFTSSANPQSLIRRLYSYIFGKADEDTRKILSKGDNFSIVKTKGENKETGYLEAWGYFSNNSTSFMMSMPLASLREAVSFFNFLLLFLGGGILLFGTLAVYITGRRVTRPLKELAKLSQKMSQLDFTARFQGSHLEEIEVLGESMNSLSQRLEETIGDLKKANNELQSDIENKTLIDQRRQEFVANVSHELKTPIALIMGYAEGLGEGLCEDEESRAYYSSVIVDEAKRMNHMVRELMSLSAMEQGKDLPDFSLLDMAKLTKGVLGTMEILLKQEEISVEVDIPEGLFLWGDEFKIEEVLMNYLQNAIHHVGEPKQISIYTENRGQKQVEIHVRNTGNPIPEEDLPRVFEKFYKVDKAHSRSYGGSGLGLSIVKAIMDSHHQECGCKNTLTGVDFWFTLEKGEMGKT